MATHESFYCTVPCLTVSEKCYEMSYICDKYFVSANKSRRNNPLFRLSVAHVGRSIYSVVCLNDFILCCALDHNYTYSLVVTLNLLVSC